MSKLADVNNESTTLPNIKICSNNNSSFSPYKYSINYVVCMFYIQNIYFEANFDLTEYN